MLDSALLIRFMTYVVLTAVDFLLDRSGVVFLGPWNDQYAACSLETF